MKLPKIEFTACDDWRRHNHKFSYLVRDDEDDDDGAGNVCLSGREIFSCRHALSERGRAEAASGSDGTEEGDRKFAM